MVAALRATGKATSSRRATIDVVTRAPAAAVYLDHSASTPCDPAVAEAMAPWLVHPANPSSRDHGPGREAATALEEARRTVAEVLGASRPAEIVLCGSATEANHLALEGLARRHHGRRRHLVTQATEHPSVLAPLERLGRDGFELTVLPVGDDGRLDPERFRAALRDDTLLASVMLANHETGTLQPVRELATAAHDREVLLHSDASQAVGKVPVDVGALGVDLLTCSGHKVYGPPGIGALWVSRRAERPRLRPLLVGGGQEAGRRAGTPNLPAAVGLATALVIARDVLAAESDRLARLRDRLEGQLVEALDGARVNGCRAARLPGATNLAFPGVDGAALVTSLPDLAVSRGAACSAGGGEPSAVLRAMGLPRTLAGGSLRLTVGRFTTTAEVEHAVARITTEVRRLRALAQR